MPLNYSQNLTAAEMFDDVTGLKTRAMLLPDTRLELDRIARGGEPFSFALLRIDGFEKIKASNDKAIINGVYEYIAGLIKQSLRSFDDAYVLNEHDFALCLKLAKVSGGLRAIERIRDELEKKEHLYEIDGQKTPVTISCCVAEPLPDEEIEELIVNLSDDLDHGRTEQGQVFSYKELSPIQRFAQNQE